jgi:hypothetical protein
MKTSLLLWILAGGALTCTAADLVRPNETPATWIDPTDPAITAIRQTGERLIDRVGHLMIYEVERTIADKGLAKAVETVHLKDLTLPKPEPGQPRVTAIRRTSLGLRNPANQPDAADQAALELINVALRDGNDVPSVLVQRLEHPGGSPEWRVYRPITTMPLCLKCHGPLEDLKPEVRSYLALKYPEDKATGYTAYKWRGLIRVSLAAPEPAVAAKAK